MATTSNRQPAVFARDGWTRIPDVLTGEEATVLAGYCLERLAHIGDDARVGDKPWAGTRRLVDLVDRVPVMAKRILTDPAVVDAVESVLGPNAAVGEFTFRCPFPGFGEQKLHADDVPLTGVDQTRGLTAIVPLVDFTPNNGATRLVPGSHRRPDLQRLSGNLDNHPDEIVLTGRAGGMFVFSRHVLHSGTKNRSTAPRPALQISWVASRP